jgi:hypothetical protein
MKKMYNEVKLDFFIPSPFELLKKSFLFIYKKGHFHFFALSWGIVQETYLEKQKGKRPSRGVPSYAIQDQNLDDFQLRT